MLFLKMLANSVRMILPSHPTWDKKALCVDCTFDQKHSTYTQHTKDISNDTASATAQTTSQEFAFEIAGVTLNMNSQFVTSIQEL